LRIDVSALIQQQIDHSLVAFFEAAMNKASPHMPTASASVPAFS
jgi:hypothetical protein